MIIKKSVKAISLSFILLLTLTSCSSNTNKGTVDENNVSINSLVDGQIAVGNSANVIVFNSSLQGFLESVKLDALSSAKPFDKAILTSSLLEFKSNSGGLKDIKFEIFSEKISFSATIEKTLCRGDFLLSTSSPVGNTNCK